MKQKLVVIGNGMAPGRALEHLFERAPDAYEVTIFNAEPRVNYDRILLSPVLSGEKSYDDIVIHGDGWYIEHNVTLYKGHNVTAIDRRAQTVTSAHGVTVPYDKLIIATGSNPVIIPVPGHQLAGVLTYRDLDDVHAMMLAARSGGRRGIDLRGRCPGDARWKYPHSRCPGCSQRVRVRPVGGGAVVLCAGSQRIA